MALQISIPSTEYIKLGGKDHLAFNVLSRHSKLEVISQRRYSEFRVLHRKLEASKTFFKDKALPVLPSWIRLKALFTNKMNQQEVESRRLSLEQYLKELEPLLITRSTPFLEKFLKLPTDVVSEWINHYQGFMNVNDGHTYSP